MASVLSPQHVQITTPDLRGIHQQPHIDPDISATLSDFLAYTEHLPSSVVRSLSLISEQDRIASDLQQTIHELLTTYGVLPSLKDGPDVVVLRRDISRAYERLEKARRMAAAEAVRMADMVAKDRVRLDTISQKLKKMPMPPSRDPTPEPISSPQLRKMQPTSEKRAAHRTGTAPRVRGQKIMVPGEVLPPQNPDSPPPSEPSDWESPRASPEADRRQRQKSVGRPRTPKPPKIPKEKSTPKHRRSRTPGMPGTNVHSQIAGISTSNALLALVPPPEDARPGSKWKPWKKITEFELAKLRKRMKKNAIWLPSPAMRNRELKQLGRGQQAMDQAMAVGEAGGEPFIDEYRPDWVDPTKAVVSGEDKAEMNAMYGPEIVEPANATTTEDDALMNRGMRLNEAKKRKKERQAEEQAIQAQLNAEQGFTEPRLPPDAIGDFKGDKSGRATASVEGSQRKRKREATPSRAAKLDPSVLESPDVLSLAAPQAKKLKISIPAASTRQGPASANLQNGRPIPSPLRSAELQASRAHSRHTSLAPDAATGARRGSTKITIKPSKAASAEPPNRRTSLRRGSNASLPSQGKLGSPAPNTLPASQQNGGRGGGRRKRPAPGLITADEDGGAKLSVVARKSAPKKKTAVAQAQKQEKEAISAPAAEEEFVDPNEPRYCVCGDVSWGTMIACDNDDCDREWFHLECVNLQDMPPRRTKWYCPDCRKKLKLGQNTNGVVKP